MPLVKCRSCKDLLCDNHRYRVAWGVDEDRKYTCNSCVCSGEAKILAKRIPTTNVAGCDVVPLKIIEVISEFAVGYLFTCCNEVDGCKNEIIVNSKIHLREKIDANGNYLRYYPARYLVPSRPTVIIEDIFTEHCRLFCHDCCETKLDDCVYCRNREVTVKDERRLCNNHPLCGKCGVHIEKYIPARHKFEVRNNVFHKVTKRGMMWEDYGYCLCDKCKKKARRLNHTTFIF